MLRYAAPADVAGPFVVDDLEVIDLALRAAGVARADRESGIELFGRTVRSPMLRFTIRLRRLGQEVLFDGALGPALVLFAGGAYDGGDGSLILGTPDQLPRAIAEIVELGPRPLDAERPEIPMPYDPLDAYAGVGCEDELLAVIADAFDGEFAPDVVAGLFDGQALRWTLEFATSDGPQSVLDVIDADDRGLWVIDEGPEPGTAWVRPMTSSAAWLLITGSVNALVLAVAT